MIDILLAILLLAFIVLLLAIAHKVRRIHFMAYRIESELEKAVQQLSGLGKIDVVIDNLYRQIQAYEDLNRLIEPRKPLPILRGWAASPDFLLEITRHALSNQPKIIVECSSGASTLALARCCELNGIGHVYSLEHDAGYAEQTRKRLSEQNLDRWATVVNAPLIEQPIVGGQRWYSLTNLHIGLGSCELLVIDGPPIDTSQNARQPAIPMLSRFLSHSCTVFLDDAKRPDEERAVRRWLADFPVFRLEQPQCEKGCAKLIRE